MKAEKKATEKEAKVKEQLEQKKESSSKGAQGGFGADEETLDPNVSFLNVTHCSNIDQPKNATNVW